MREMHKWKDKVELSLDNRQIFFLFFGLSVVGCFVFALGVITYRALTGRPAFTGEDGAITMYNVVHVQPVRPGELARLAADVDFTLALALAKDPARRFSSANSFAAALRDALRGELDERMRRDARDLLARHPWGADVTRRDGGSPPPA